MSRRRFLTTTAGLAGILATGIPPARGQQRQISYLCWNNFAPASDKKLAEIGLRFTKDTGIKIRIWGHVQVAGILRSLGYDTKGTPKNEPKGDALGWGINLSGTINTWGRDKILLQYVYGHGIASYMNDGGMDLAPEGRLPTDTDPGNAEAEAVPLTGIVAYYDHYWNDQFSTSIGYSTTSVDNTNLQTDDTFESAQYTSVNLLYYPVDRVMIGGEILWGDLEYKDGQSADDTRIQFSVKYSWGKTF